jgi:hypothetical protein
MPLRIPSSKNDISEEKLFVAAVKFYLAKVDSGRHERNYAADTYLSWEMR